MSVLIKYSRVPGINVCLPSKGAYGPENINLDAAGSVRTLPMTANDELALNSPDLLISGRAINMVLESCCPDIENVGGLPNIDVEALLLAIKCNSSGEKLDISGNCEKCEHEYVYDVSIPNLIQQITFIEDQQIIELSSGVKIILGPLTWDQSCSITFELMKEGKSYEDFIKNNQDDNLLFKRREQLHIIVRELNLKSITNCIIAAITPENITVNNYEDIYFFLKDLTKSDFQLVENSWAELNKKGLPRNIDVKCENCGHEQHHKLEYNPVTFLGLG
jgi:hypothetical protein